MKRWTNQAAIEQWAAMPHEVLAGMAADGDFSKRHLVNPVLLRMLGDLTGHRVLDADCGNGYFSRILARRGAIVTGVEPASALAASWREHGAYQVSEYLADYEIDQRYATDFHRPLSAYLNEVIGLGCRIAEVAEPGLSPQIAAQETGGDHPYLHLPDFLIVAADLS